MTGVPDQAMRLTCMTQGVEVPDLRESDASRKNSLPRSYQEPFKLSAFQFSLRSWPC